MHSSHWNGDRRPWETAGTGAALRPERVPAVHMEKTRMDCLTKSKHATFTLSDLQERLLNILSGAFWWTWTGSGFDDSKRSSNWNVEASREASHEESDRRRVRLRQEAKLEGGTDKTVEISRPWCVCRRHSSWAKAPVPLECTGAKCFPGVPRCDQWHKPQLASENCVR